MGSLGAFFQLHKSELVVRYWSLLIDSAIWKTNPLGFHLTNALLHAATGLALFAYLRGLLSASASPETAKSRPRAAAGPAGTSWRDWSALAASLLFVAHPMQTEAVAGVTHRKEILATLFLVLALWRSLPPAAPRLGPARALRAIEVGVYVALAMFAKAPAVVFFPLVFLQDLWARRQAFTTWIRRDLVFYLPAVLALIAYLAYRWGGIQGAVDADPVYFEAYNPQAAKLSTGGRLLTSLTVLGLYWRLLFIPWRPTLERFVAPAEGAAPLVMLVLVVVALVFAFQLGRRRPLIALGLAWLVLAPIPTLNLLPLNFLFAERYLYLPAVGVALLAAALVAWLPERVRSARTATVAGLGALLLFFAPLTVARNLEWHDVDTLLRATVRDNATSPRVVFLHARDLRDQGKIAESLAEAQRAMRLQPNSPDAWYLAGRNYADLGKKAEALDAYQRAVTLARSPRASWLNDYAVALIQNGRAPEAGPVLEDALRRDPDSERARDNYAQLLLYRPETRARGMEFLLEETRRRPADFTPWVLLVEARLASGDGPGAQQAAQAASAALTDPAERQFLAARMAEATGRMDEATRIYRELAASPEADASLRDRVRGALRRVGTIQK
jgi:tetratricopeptide (TPR) repeat protein